MMRWNVSSTFLRSPYLKSKMARIAVIAADMTLKSSTNFVSKSYDSVSNTIEYQYLLSVTYKTAYNNELLLAADPL